jgi:hypothetical protein
MLVSLLSLLATGASVLLFLSPWSEVKKAYQLGSTRGQSALPFVCMWANCALWLLYGLQIKVSVIIVVNGTGAILSSFYTYVWIKITTATERTQIVLCALSAVCFVSWAALYSANLAGPYIETNILPWIATAVCVVMFASPLIAVVSIASFWGWMCRI